MSYNISITRNQIPADDRSAWEYLNELDGKDSGIGASDFIDLIKKLTSKYPCICDLPDENIDEGVWSDGPLINNAGNEITTLGVVYSHVDTVIPFVIETANNDGFVVFDGQTGLIFRPNKKVVEMPTNTRKSFFKRIFGNLS